MLQVYSFGCNDDGALGRATPDDDECFTPAAVNIPGKVVQISAGDSHSAALTEDGQAYYWGTFRDSSGPYGLTPDGERQNLPVELASHLKVKKIASGSDHIALLTREGRVFTVGTAEQGQLGRVGERFVRRGGRRGLSLILTPDVVHAKNKRVVFEDVWAGSYNTYALTSDSDVLVCGLNNYHQLGVPQENMFFTMVKSGALTSLGGEAGLAKIVPGQHHAVILDGKKRVFVIGRKEYGRLGLGQEDNANQAAEAGTPTAVDGLKDVTDVAAGL